MADRQRVALVTGANRGIGYEVAKQLGRAGMRVLVTSRDEAEGRRAVESLKAEGITAEREKLDVADPPSVAKLAERLASRGEILDVLVNNAGVAMKGFDASVADRTLTVNFRGAMTVTDVLSPAIRDDGRIVMVSSGQGEVSSLSEGLQRRFLNPSLDRRALCDLTDEFVRDVFDGTHSERGWPTSAYRVSKIALNAFTRIVARELSKRSILVNAVCPGWVRTDLGGPNGERSAAEGARGVVWAAVLSDAGPTGGFFRDREPLPW
jgi:NAD(P)-dependent dehydrogenase (short-subunit alcohol dehydrogenase family)